MLHLEMERTAARFTKNKNDEDKLDTSRGMKNY